ncbi:hypothetical protein AB0M12_42240 [Nocardia vinacea]|uniref:hypothetical protein n=1 Tax=Nocardia vinacea TaxID=96468 RepID=UPI00341F18CC
MTDSQANGLDMDRARDLCDRIQAVVEDLHAIVGAPKHPAIALLMKAADEITATAMADAPRRYADYEPKSA